MKTKKEILDKLNPDGSETIRYRECLDAMQIWGEIYAIELLKTFIRFGFPEATTSDEIIRIFNEKLERDEDTIPH